MRVKICGITRPEDARYAEQQGADAIGVIVFSDGVSKRDVGEEKAREIFDAVGPFTTTVAVSHTTSEEELRRMIELHPHAIQISHPFRFDRDPGVRIIRVIGRGDPLPEDCDAVIIDDSHGKGRDFDASYARACRGALNTAGYPCRGPHPGECQGGDPQGPALRGGCGKRCRDFTGDKGQGKSEGIHRRMQERIT